MKVFRPNETSHTLIIIPRFYALDVSLNIRHELTDNAIIIENLLAFKDNGYLSIEFDFQFKEGASYEITCTSDTQLVWRGKAYATDVADLENYKLL